MTHNLLLQASDSIDEPHGIFCGMACPEHYNLLIENNILYKTLPINPKRLLLFEDNISYDSKQLLNYLNNNSNNNESNNMKFRCGSFTLHSIGYIKLELLNFYNKSYIYPYKYCSSRIYWSMKVPLKRVLYIFDILTENDLENEYNMQLNNEYSQQNDYENNDNESITDNNSQNNNNNNSNNNNNNNNNNENKNEK